MPRLVRQQALFVLDGPLLLDAHQDLVRAGVAPVQVMAVVGGDGGDAGLLRQLDDLLVDLHLLG